MDSMVRGKLAPTPVHLVDETDAGDHIGVRLSPDGLGLGLNSGHRIQHNDSAVQYAETAFHLSGEVHVARGINNVYPVFVPLCSSSGRGYGYAPFPFLGHEIHRRSTLVNAANLVNSARQVKHPFGNGGLARVNVSNEPNVSDFVYRISRDHIFGLL